MSSSRVPRGKNRKLLCLLIHNYENEDNKGAGLREERTQARGVESMRHTVLSFTSRASYCDMILKSRPKFLRITFALVPPLISVLSGYSRPLLPPLPYSHPDYRFGQILVGERISDCLCFTKKKKMMESLWQHVFTVTVLKLKSWKHKRVSKKKSWAEEETVT